METSAPSMSLQAEGFRFVRRDGVWSWTHPAEIRPTDFDATDMPDEEFELLINKYTENSCRSIFSVYSNTHTSNVLAGDGK
jgi:hypothetical protein